VRAGAPRRRLHLSRVQPLFSLAFCHISPHRAMNCIVILQSKPAFVAVCGKTHGMAKQDVGRRRTAITPRCRKVSASVRIRRRFRSYRRGLHSLLTVCSGCNLCNASETDVHAGFVTGVRELAEVAPAIAPGAPPAQHQGWSPSAVPNGSSRERQSRRGLC
jgi:hypothetical protein